MALITGPSNMQLEEQPIRIIKGKKEKVNALIIIITLAF